MVEAVRRGSAGGLHWPAAIWAGVVAGAVFLLLEMILVPALGRGSAWDPPRMIAAIALGEEVLKPPTFALGAFVMALIIHFALSMAYTILLAVMVSRMSSAGATLTGVVFGLVLYGINFYFFTALFPWFALARDGLSLFVHGMWGAVAGYCYPAFREARPPGTPIFPTTEGRPGPA
jgi:hypothetical protein